MAILFCEKVFDQAIGGAVTVYTRPELNRRMAEAEKFYIQIRVTQVSGSSPTMGVKIDQSNDGLFFTNKATLIAPYAILPNAVNDKDGFDLGTAAVGGCAMRLSFTLGGGTPNAYVEAWLTGRSND